MDAIVASSGSRLPVRRRGSGVSIAEDRDSRLEGGFGIEAI
jgi:hypothetical protein